MKPERLGNKLITAAFAFLLLWISETYAMNEGLSVSINPAPPGGATSATVSILNPADVESFSIILYYSSGDALSLPSANWFSRGDYFPSSPFGLEELNNVVSSPQNKIYIDGFDPYGTSGNIGQITFNVSPNAANGYSQVLSLSGEFFSISEQAVKQFQSGSATFTVGNSIQQYSLTLTKQGTGTGTVTSSPVGISCGPACPTASYMFNSGTQVILSASAATGSKFTGWTEACSGASTTCQVTVNAAKTVKAVFDALEKCDGIDNDANAGTPDGADEVWYGQQTTCGTGICIATGHFTCSGGSKTDTCVAGTPTEIPEHSCSDNLDNDCDGQKDCNDSDCCAQATDYYCDHDNDGYFNKTVDGNCTGAGCVPQGCVTTQGNDCNDNDIAVHPGAGEICDGKDNDCNPETLDGAGETLFDKPCDGEDTDLCEEGVWTCSNSAWSCSDTTGNTAEICNDQLDNDCDGAIDCCDSDCGTMCQPSRPSLTIPELVPGSAGSKISVPVNYSSNGNLIASMIFSIDYDSRCLLFNPADENQDGIPDAVKLNLPSSHTAAVTFNGADTDGEIDFLIADTTMPLESIADNTITTVDFTVACNSMTNQTLIAPVKFSGDPLVSFGNTGGQSILGCMYNGSVEIMPVRNGDCNGDSKVDAGDISALVLEIFDGDGNLAQDATGGTFPGHPVGSDANGDGFVDAGDITCTVLIIFNGPGACGG